MEQNHIINKVVIEVTVGNKEKANEIKDSISSFLAMEIFPKLEKCLNTTLATVSAHTLQISRLTINLDESQSSLNAELKNIIIESFEKELIERIKPVINLDSEVKKDSEINFLGEEESLVSTFIYFIENGHMPWWNSNEKSVAILNAEVFKKTVAAKSFVNKIAYSLQKEKARERIINQLTDAQIIQICKAIIKANGLEIAIQSSFIKQLTAHSFEDRKAIWLLILDILITSFTNSNANIHEYTTEQAVRAISSLKSIKIQNSEEQIWKELTSIFPTLKQNEDFISVRNKYPDIPNKDTGSVINTPEKVKRDQTVLGTQEDKTVDDNGYQVQNAGLVLIHPFIANLFKNCSLIDLETKKLIDPEICVHLLHYIATGKTNQPESNMLFEKFLCNTPMDQSINRHIKLTRKQKIEAAKVIGAVQQNWSSMKTASVELLQNEFFQRPGKLVLNSSQTLTIERKTQDILLDKLTWGISFMKLTWQNKFIYVNW